MEPRDTGVKAPYRIPAVLGWAGLGSTCVYGVFFVAIPLWAVLKRSFTSSAVMVDPAILSIAKATLSQAGLSTLISAGIGLPLGLWVGRLSTRDHPGAAWARILLALPYGVPTVVAATAWIVWLGRSGLLAKGGLALDWAYSLKAVILAHIFLNTPWIALVVAESRRHLPLAQLEAAISLGAGGWDRFRHVIWPFVRWALGSASAQVFALCTLSFALVLILGGGPPVQTLETELYSRVRFGSLDISGAAACACWELLLSLVPWGAVLWIQSKRERRELIPMDHPRKIARACPNRRKTSFLHFLQTGSCVVICFAFLLPYLSLVILNQPWKLFLPGAEPILQPMKTSLTLALVSSFGAVWVALAGILSMARLRSRSSLRPILAVLIALPSGVSALVFGLGFWLAYGNFIDPFSGSLAAMAAIQIALLSPLAFRMLWPVALGTRIRLLETAASLGASVFQAFWAVEWPRWRGSILGALAILAGVSVGEVAAVSLFYSEDLIPLPLLVSRWMAQYRFADAQALAALLFILSTGMIAGMSLLGNLDAQQPGR